MWLLKLVAYAAAAMCCDMLTASLNAGLIAVNRLVRLCSCSLYSTALLAVCSCLYSLASSLAAAMCRYTALLLPLLLIVLLASLYWGT
jgi:hypothetical protein